MADSANDNRNRHTVTYTILNMRPNDPPREIEVHATREEIHVLAEEGFLVRERMFTGEALEQLRKALDNVEAKEKASAQSHAGGRPKNPYGGFYYRYLMDKEQAFLDLINCQPLLSVARAMLGPMVKLDVAARVSYPGDDHQETEWHIHRRCIPKPLPPWFMHPHALDILIYLDDVDEANGPLCVLPGSHRRVLEEPAAEFYGDYPGQVKLYPPAGTAVLMHTNLWHRAFPTTPEGTKRRVLITCYSPTWLKKGKGVRPESGLTFDLPEDLDEETLELLGKKGFM